MRHIHPTSDEVLIIHREELLNGTASAFHKVLGLLCAKMTDEALITLIRQNGADISDVDTMLELSRQGRHWCELMESVELHEIATLPYFMEHVKDGMLRALRQRVKAVRLLDELGCLKEVSDV